MDSNHRVKDLVDKIFELERTVHKELISSKEEGILDESYESYLNAQLKDLFNQKQKIFEEFCRPDLLKVPQKSNRATMPPKRQQKQGLELFRSSKTLFPFNKPPAEKIFSKKVSPQRGNSPSAMRYSPQNSPMLSPASGPSSSSGRYTVSPLKSEQIKHFDLMNSRDSPLCSTRSSASSIERVPAGELNAELYQKYQEQREIRNKAHQEMLLLKERMLNEKEMKLEALMKAFNKKSEKYSSDIKEEVKSIKPPLSPVMNKSKLKQNNDRIVSFM